MGQWAWTGSDFLWMLIAFLLGVCVTVIYYWAKNNNTSVKWWEWLLGALGVFSLMFMLQNITTAGYEEVPGSVGPFLLFFGIIGVILLAIPFRTVTTRRSSG
jgi:phosphatidylserine synthase